MLSRALYCNLVYDGKIVEAETMPIYYRKQELSRDRKELEETHSIKESRNEPHLDRVDKVI